MARSINDALESLRLTLISGLDPHRPIRGTCPAGPTTIWRAFTRFTNDTTAQFKDLTDVCYIMPRSCGIGCETPEGYVFVPPRALSTSAYAWWTKRISSVGMMCSHDGLRPLKSKYNHGLRLLKSVTYPWAQTLAAITYSVQPRMFRRPSSLQAAMYLTCYCPAEILTTESTYSLFNLIPFNWDT